MVVSSQCAADADTRATAPPLKKPSQPARLVAPRSWGSALGGKVGGFFRAWLGSWLGDPLGLLKLQAQLGVAERRARFT